MAQITILNFSEIVKENRLDAEFYKKDYTDIDKIISSQKFVTLLDASKLNL